MKLNLSLEDKLGIKIFGIVIGIVFLLILFALVVSLNRVDYDRKSLCKVDDGYTTHRVLLIDTTDKLTSFQGDYLRNNVEWMINNAQVFDRFTIYMIDIEKGGLSDPIFDMCQPDDGKGMNPLYENPALAKRKFEERFRQRISDLVNSMSDRDALEESPILEAVSDLYKLNAFDELASNREIHLYSDLLQNTAQTSVYKSQSLPTSRACESPEESASIYVNVFEANERARDRQTPELITQWVTYLGFCITGRNRLEIERIRY